MSDYKEVFQRYEKKYIVTGEQYDALYDRIGSRLTPDAYGNSTVCNIYYDTADKILIRRSIDKPVYKEKLRLRSYGVPSDNTTVFVELKKKFKGLVFKRRVDMDYSDAKLFLSGGKPPIENQIVSEIEWFLDFYKTLKPSAYIAYDRIAYYSLLDPDIRITFDSNPIWRDTHLSLSDGIWGEKLLDSDKRIMEIKILHSMPLWLADALNEFEIYPASFSKYGNAYTEIKQRADMPGEDFYCA